VRGSSPDEVGNGSAPSRPIASVAAGQPDDGSLGASPPPSSEPRSVHPLAALAPRAPKHRSAGYPAALFEAYRRFVMARTVVAIAEHWDSGRIGFSNLGGPPFADEVFGLAERRTGLAKDQLAEAHAILEAASAGLEAALTAVTGRLTPLDVLVDEYRLSTMGGVILMLVAAPALWGDVVRAYGILGNDPGRPICDEYLLCQLLGASCDRRAIARELDPDSPLVRHGLVIGERGQRPFQALVASAVVVKLIGGVPVDDIVEPGVARVPATVPLDQFMAPAGVIDRALAALAAAPAGRGRVVVRGRTGSGRRTLLATLAQRAGRTLATIDAATLVGERRVAALTELLQRAHQRGWLPCVDGLEAIGSDDASARRAIREIVRAHPGPVAVRLGHDALAPLEPGYVQIDLPVSTTAERAKQWSQLATEVGLGIDGADEIAARFTVGPGTIRSVLTAAARSTPEDPGPALETALRQHVATRIGEVATRVTRLASWSQVVLPTELEDGIAELVARIRHRLTVYDTWGFDQVLSTSRGIVALFQGGPGTGKTLVASALARELGLDLYRVDLERMMSKWIGETEKNLAQAFDAVEEGQALLLFDEADALFGHRGAVRGAVDRYANSEVNYLLQRLDTFEGVAVLTTNLDMAIDPAFKRRLTCRLTFPFPDQEARERLWRAHLPAQMPRAGTLDLPGLARRYQMSGGYIRNAAVRAAFLAAQDGAPLSQFHLERAIRAEFRSSGHPGESGVLQ